MSDLFIFDVSIVYIYRWLLFPGHKVTGSWPLVITLWT